jgi:cyclohexadieny/prephenate dehydrogenase
MLFPRIAIIGLGMIGSSVGRAVRARALTAMCVGYDLDPVHSEQALIAGAVDHIAASARNAVMDADLVVLGVSPTACGPVCAEIAPALKPGAVVTDVGSVKRYVMQEVRAVFPPHAAFVPGHPIAGSERSGPLAGDEALFEGKSCILTPETDDDADSIQRVRQFWEALGARVTQMDATLHDRVFALTSHLPHLLAFAHAGSLPEGYTPASEVMQRHLRIAASNRFLWADIMACNQAFLDPASAECARLLGVWATQPEAYRAAWEEAASFRRALGGGVRDSGTVPAAEQTVLASAQRLCTAYAQVLLQAEHRYSVPLREHLGAGFMDFTMPLCADPVS